MGFWERLPKPFFALAPMADVTDAAFRQIVAKASRHGEIGGGPDVFWTEFVSADGLMQGGREVLQRDLAFTKGEHPIVAQIFGSNPKNIESAAKLCAELGFDGIDINMGCPDKSIEKQGAGACMIKTPEVALEVIRAAKRGAPNLPISVKTRIGYNTVEIDTWIPKLLNEGVAALTVHARTRKEMSKVPARWEFITRVVKMRDELGVPTKIIGNGDVMDLSDGEKKVHETGCDGIMVGRAIFGNPWLFDRNRQILQKGNWQLPWYARFLPARFAKKFNGGDARYTISSVSKEERLSMLVEHATLFETMLGDIKSFSIMKKHVKAYIHGWPGSKELRMKIMDEATNAETLKAIIETYGKKS
jgi:nifR3 family TIM-barrel protein